MEKPYKVYLDVTNNRLKEQIVEKLFDASFIDNLLVLENECSLFSSRHSDLTIFDLKGNRSNIIDYCHEKLNESPKTIFIHIKDDEPFRCDQLHLIGISNDFFDEYFSHLVGLCFLTHSVRESVKDIEKLLLPEIRF